MPRIALDLNKAEDLKRVKGQWRVGQGLVPGQPNEGLVAQILNSPARLADYDDSGWEICSDIRKSRSMGFTFAWYRISVELPHRADSGDLESGTPGTQALAGQIQGGCRVWFETNIDNYGEIWIDGRLDRAAGAIIGINAQQRIEVSAKAVPEARHVIACLVVNGPLAEPRGGIFMRYATLAFESAG